jgi:glycosyltransferase involved in cell wall biosynthesis
MTFHIVLPRPMRLPEGADEALNHQAPRHSMWLLRNSLSATLREPDGSGSVALDKLRAMVAPPVSLWGLARKVHTETAPGDVVFCSSEAGGLQLAALCGNRSRRPRLALFVHNVDRPRAHFALKFWRMAKSVDLFLACSATQVVFLREFLRLPEDRVRHVWDHTDTRFFTPGPVSTGKARPLVVSVGLEQRDYKTLAAATHDLDVDVRISGFSKDAAAMARTFPESMPANMSRRFYAWPELVQLYRDADVVVVSCHENRYAAGVQSLMEAMACGRPVIATATVGLEAYLGDPIIPIRPGDAGQMRAAIQASLADRADAEARALRGRSLAAERYAMERYVDEIGSALRALA